MRRDNQVIGTLEVLFPKITYAKLFASCLRIRCKRLVTSNHGFLGGQTCSTVNVSRQ